MILGRHVTDVDEPPGHPAAKFAFVAAFASEKAAHPARAPTVAQAAYNRWKAQKNASANPEVDPEEEEDGGEAVAPQHPAATLDQIQELASTGLKDQINLRNPYEFQDLVAALLRGMGYYTPFVAPKGKDGGVDVCGVDHA